MIFNALNFNNDSTNETYTDVTRNDNIHNCNYLTHEQFRLDPNASRGKINFMNVNIRSLSKNLDSLKECIKSCECKFDIIGISETHLKDKPNDLQNVDGFNIEYTKESVEVRVGWSCI